MALHYCKKCGRIVELDDSVSKKCDYCSAVVYPVPEKYWLDGLDFLITKEQEQLLIEELIETAPEFDPSLSKRRCEDMARSNAEWEAMYARTKAFQEGRDVGNPFGVECPYCHATNVKKITTVSKALHTALFGVFSVSRNSKEFHCNHCNSDF